MNKALIIVDMQNDFMPGGSFPVMNGDEIIPLINELQNRFNVIVATQDWHPADHKSFAINHPEHQVGDVINLNGISQTLWPAHCVQNTHGAELAPKLDKSRIKKIFHKGSDLNIDSYSAFFDNAHRRSTGLDQYLKSLNIDELYLVGVCTDYCVKFSAHDAINLGFDVYVIEDACKGIDLHLGDIQQSIEEMQAAGCHIISSEKLLRKAA